MLALNVTFAGDLFDSRTGVLRRSGDRIPVGARFSAPVHTGPAAYPASCTMGTWSFPGVKRPGRGVDHPPQSSVEVKEKVELYLCSPSGPSWPVLGRTLHVPFTKVLTAVNVTIKGSYDVTSCSLVYRYRSSDGPCVSMFRISHFYLENWGTEFFGNTSMYNITWFHIPEDYNLNQWFPKWAVPPPGGRWH
jgi:hypothetical protein